MALVTLTTDYGLADPYLAMLKSRLLQAIPGATLLDISHGIRLADIAQAVWVFRTAAAHLPTEAVNLVSVGETVGDGQAVAFRWRGLLMVSMDNGFPDLLAQVSPAEQLVSLPIQARYPAFPSLELIEATAQLAQGQPLESLGPPMTAFATRLKATQPIIRQDQILGTVQFVDAQGNLISNISQATFEAQRLGRAFEIRAGIERINRIYHHYDQREFGDCLAFFNAGGWLEIAINTGNAGQLLGLKTDSPISVRFFQV